MPSPWYVDAITFGCIISWMAFTYGTIQQYGPSIELIGSAVIVGVVGILWIYGQRVTYLQVGNYLVVGLDTPSTRRDDPDEPSESRSRYE